MSGILLDHSSLEAVSGDPPFFIIIFTRIAVEDKDAKSLGDRWL